MGGVARYMRNPYIRAKMVEALVAFLPAEVINKKLYGSINSDPNFPFCFENYFRFIQYVKSTICFGGNVYIPGSVLVG